MSLVRDLEKTFSDLWHHEASAKAPDSTWVRVRPRADTRLCVYREAACRHQAASLPIFSLASLTESLHIDGRSEVLSGGRAQSVLVSSWLCSSGGPVAPGAAHLAGLSVFCVLGRISRMGGPWYLL